MSDDPSIFETDHTPTKDAGTARLRALAKTLPEDDDELAAMIKEQGITFKGGKVLLGDVEIFGHPPEAMYRVCENPGFSKEMEWIIDRVYQLRIQLPREDEHYMTPDQSWKARGLPMKHRPSRR